MKTTDDAADGPGSDSAVPEWDDAAFVKRVTDAAKARGITAREVMVAAGVAGDYLNKAPILGRNIGQVLKIARFLEIDPVVLMGLDSGEDRQPSPLAALNLTAKQLDRLAMVASIAAHLKVALEPRPRLPEIDTQKLVDAVLRAVAEAA